MSRIRRPKSYAQKSAEKLASRREQHKPALTLHQKIALDCQQQEKYLSRLQQGRYKQMALGAGGARPNNMAPSKYRGDEIADNGPVTILQQGIDSIWLNAYGSVKEYVLFDLAGAKEAAQAAEGEWAVSSLPAFDGAPLPVYASGVKGYDYLCKSDDIEVKIRRPSNSPKPQIVVRVSAQALWRLGCGGWTAIDAAVVWLRSLFDEDGARVVPSAVHLATDWQGWRPTTSDLENVVKRANDQAEYDDEMPDEAEVQLLGRLRGYRNRARQLTGLSAGVSTNLRLNCYDKDRQALKENLDWVHASWEQNPGYNPRQGAMRLEYQFGREFLHKRGIETLDDLRAQLAALWEYGWAWYSFRTPSATDTNRSRWEKTTAWLALSKWGGHEAKPLTRAVLAKPRFDRLAAQWYGLTTTMQALAGYDSLYQTQLAAQASVRDAKGPERMARVIEEKRQRYARLL